jgi:hypothetical protein
MKWGIVILVGSVGTCFRGGTVMETKAIEKNGGAGSLAYSDALLQRAWAEAIDES